MAEAAAAETAAARLRKFAGGLGNLQAAGPASTDGENAFEGSAWNLDDDEEPDREGPYLQHLDTSEIIHRYKIL